MADVKQLAHAITNVLARSVHSRFNGGASDPLLAFHAATPDDDGVMQLQVTGSGTPTAEHTATIYTPDEATGYYSAFGADEAVWAGGRAVENLATNIDLSIYNTTNSTIATGIAGPTGGTDAIRVTSTGFNGRVLRTQTYTVKIGNNYIYSGWVRVVTYLSGNIEMYCGVDSPETSSARWVIDSVIDTTDNGDWQPVSIAVTADGTSSKILGIIAGVAGNVVEFDLPQVEDATGRSDTTTPSEYVGTTKKVFAHANGNSVLNNIVTEARGVDFVEPPYLRYSPAATNIITSSDDATGVGWLNSRASISSDATAGLKGQTGNFIVGDDSGGGSSTVLVRQIHSVVSGETNTIRVYAACKQLDWIRVNATSFDSAPYAYFNVANGTVGIATEVAEVVSQGNGIYCCLLEFSTVTDLSGSVQINVADADGDGNVDRDGTSDVYVFQTELHKGMTIEQVRSLPPVFTSGDAASIDEVVISYDDANHAQTKSGYIVDFTPSYATAEVSDDLEILSLANGSNLLYYDGTNGNFESTDGTNTAAVAQALVAGTSYQVSLAIGESNMSIAVDAGAWVEASYDGTYTLGTLLQVCRNHGYAAKIRDLRGYTGSYTSVKDELDTLRGA